MVCVTHTLLHDMCASVCSGEPGKADAVRPVPIGEAVAGRETAGGAGGGQRHQGQEDIRTHRHRPKTGD